MFPIIIALVLIAFAYYQKNKKEPEKIFGIYSQPGKWYIFKYFAFLALLTARRFKYYLLGRSLFIKEKNYEQLKPLSDDEKAFDAVFFQAVTQDGFYFAAGTERRHRAKVNGLCYIKTPEHGLLLSSKLPKTVLDADSTSILTNKFYAAEGIKFTPVEPMKKWTVSFNGQMRSYENPDKLHNVSLEGKWTSDCPWFLFELDLPAKNIAESMALETWSKEFFETLKQAHQTHYEQMGNMKAILKIDDQEYSLKMDAFRDHSFGFKRDWSIMHRYIFHMFYLEDGTKVSLGVISQPCTSSHMTFGFMVHPNKTLTPIQSCDILLYQHAENGTPPSNMAFTFVSDKKDYEVKVKYDVTAIHYVGNDVEAKMHERFTTCNINGVKGRGISEWHYNNCK